MKIIEIFFKLSATIGVAALLGCASDEGWYELYKVVERNECQNQPSPAIESCLKRQEKPYGKYESERTEATRK